jgi:hypothetical protein
MITILFILGDTATSIHAAGLAWESHSRWRLVASDAACGPKRKAIEIPRQQDPCLDDVYKHWINNHPKLNDTERYLCR